MPVMNTSNKLRAQSKDALLGEHRYPNSPTSASFDYGGHLVSKFIAIYKAASAQDAPRWRVDALR